MYDSIDDNIFMTKFPPLLTCIDNISLGKIAYHFDFRRILVIYGAYTYRCREVLVFTKKYASMHIAQ